MVVGTSSGAIVAAILRAGVGAAELRERVMVTGPASEADDPLYAIAGLESFRIPKVWRGPAAPNLVVSELRRGRRVRPSNLLLGALPDGRVSTSPLRSVIETFHDSHWPDETLWITATDRQSGRRMVFGRAETALDEGTGWGTVDVATAVEASCAIPGYFAPVEIGGRQYIDGGMRSPDNADLLASAGLDVVVVSSPLSIGQYEVGRSPLLSLLRAYPRRRLSVNVEILRAEGTEVLVVQPDTRLAKAIGVNAMSPAKLRPVTEASRTAVAASLAALARSRTADPPSRRARDLLRSQH